MVRAATHHWENEGVSIYVLFGRQVLYTLYRICDVSYGAMVCWVHGCTFNRAADDIVAE